MAIAWVTIGLQVFLFSGPVTDAAAAEKSQGQTIYVPVYSNVYSGSAKRPSPLAITVCVRNMDPANEVRVQTVDYFDSRGRLVRHYTAEPYTLPPLASVRYVVKDSDKSRGAGAKFIVRWEADKPSNPLIAQGLMISTASQLGISFTTQSIVIKE